LLSFSLYSSRLIHHLHPFPTRRSSDLLGHAPHHLLQVHDARHPLHVDGNEDAVPFRGSRPPGGSQSVPILGTVGWTPRPTLPPADRKSTRLNSSHVSISYAVFCLKKKK